MKSKSTIIILAVAFVLLLAGVATAREVEVDNFMPAAESYCYNAQIHSANPTDRVSEYRLELLTQAYSTNGRLSGLEAGIKARSGINCADITFVNRVPDWFPVLERAIT